MKLIFLYSAKERDEILATAFQKGVLHSGDQCETRLLPMPPQALDADFVCLIGTKNQAWFKYCRSQKQSVLYFDKGFANRLAFVEKTSGMWRVSINNQQPTDYIATAKHSLHRWEKVFGNAVLSPWRALKPGKHVVVAHSSEKYSSLANLPHPTEWVTEVVNETRRYTDRPIYYRPKPSWKNAKPVPGTKFVQDWPLRQVLADAHVLITYGSYVCVDALVTGIPAIILGNAVTRSISSRSLTEVETPRLPLDEERRQVLANLAWCQFSVDEYRTGFAWQKIKELFLDQRGA